jgi:hypothetical protein
MLIEGHEAAEHAEVRCADCNGHGYMTGSFVTRSGEQTDRIDCPSCEGHGYVKPFAPNHGPGYDPYRLVEYEDELARRTLFTGEVKGGGA